MTKDLTKGNVTKALLLFAYPMILGNLLQQCYNIADSFIVGKFLGSGALAAVGSAYTLMTFITSVIIGLCMGSGSVFSLWFGRNDTAMLRNSIAVSFLFIGGFTVIVNGLIFGEIDIILHILNVPTDIYGSMREYVWVIFFGVFFVFLYNYSAFLLRSVGNSMIPLCFLGGAAVINIMLDILFVVTFGMGIKGAALATVIAQAVSGVGLGAYVLIKETWLLPKIGEVKMSRETVFGVVRNSLAACVQQSVMNFGILMIQGLVNSFGTAVMAAFAAAVKIDSFAYMPAQEFGNAFSLFISQNHGGGKRDRVREGLRKAVKISSVFCLCVSVIIFFLSPRLMQIFVRAEETDIISIGVGYLRIEGSFYIGIGILFLLYGFYRGIEKPEMSLILTVISLGTRVLLAYVLSPVPFIGVKGIWWAVPIGWLLADITGMVYLRNALKGGDIME
ncbi:MAG: MATE family efflux transporter [Huintestinicola sp.]|uniref:MATE family efflux transporter n=1 Tax=Huintestinicola sp. TaxID=2981661 RepID=UPI003F0767BD